MRKNKVDVVKGHARLLGGGRIEVKSGEKTQTIEAKNIILATGSEARMLPGLQPDPNLILTNIEILDMQAVPKTIGIIGAGAVGVEFASIFNRFGSKVTILEMLPRLVPVEDEEISKELEKHFKKSRYPYRDRRKGGKYPQECEQRPAQCNSCQRQQRRA